MSTTRREFWTSVGAAAVAPMVWPRLQAEVQQTGEVSAETTRTLLDLHGARGIYDHPERFEELRAAVARMIRSHARLRAFALDGDVQPAGPFEAGQSNG
jgi:hypothetical protein